jgi:hypothetical protein
MVLTEHSTRLPRGRFLDQDLARVEGLAGLDGEFPFESGRPGLREKDFSRKISR